MAKFKIKEILGWKITLLYDGSVWKHNWKDEWDEDEDQEEKAPPAEKH